MPSVYACQSRKVKSIVSNHRILWIAQEDSHNGTAGVNHCCTYNAERMMTTAGGNVSYVYDAQNRRTKKTVRARPRTTSIRAAS